MWCRDVADRMARESLFLVFAGTDTTAQGMTRAAVWLAQYPEWHQALWEEQQRLVEEFGPTIDRRVRPSKTCYGRFCASIPGLRGYDA